jgi:hypothetical protein
VTSKIAIAAAAALILSCSACTSGSAPVEDAPEPWPVSFRWDDSDPSVDLDSPGIKAIRAATESDEIELSLGREYTYPGYPESAGPNGSIGGETPITQPVHRIGTQHLKLALSSTTPSAIDAVVCFDETGVSHDAGGTYPLSDADRAGALRAISIRAELKTDEAPTTPQPADPASHQVPKMPPMEGPPGRDPRPDGNVFGDWRITHYKWDYSAPARQLCYPWADQRWGGENPPPPTRTELEPPTVEPFYPGWEN